MWSLSSFPVSCRLASNNTTARQAKPPLVDFETQGTEQHRKVPAINGLCSEFLQPASASTPWGIETCGILCGQLMRNGFFVRHVLILRQNARSYSCNIENEEGIFFRRMGWVCFLLGCFHSYMGCLSFQDEAHNQAIFPESLVIIYST